MTRRILPLLALALALGCGKPPPPSPVDVKGRVVDAAGKGVPKKVVLLTPIEESNKHGPRLSALSQDDGSFVGKCWPGKHTVSVADLTVGNPGGAGGAPGIGVGKPPVKCPDVDIPAGGASGLEVRIP